MRYPNGKIYRPDNASLTPPAKKFKQASFGRRGMKLERLINEANMYYLTKDIAVIHKKPTPIQVVSVSYPKRSRAKITEAYYRQASTTDYNGIYQGNYIDFEAKQTALKTRFPLHNFHHHQIHHMNACVKQGGICFVIFYFSSLNLAYLYPEFALSKDWTAYELGDVVSIPLARIQKMGIPIKLGGLPYIHYLAAIDELLRTRRENA